MAIQGIFASHQGIVGNRVGDFASAILAINPSGSAPLLALTSGMPNEAANDTTVTWFEENHISGRTAAVSGGVTTTVTVVDSSSFVPGTILLIEASGEILYVTANAGNVLTVIRGMSGTTVVAITGTDFAQQIGNGYEEGSSKPTAYVNQGYPRANVTQIFRNAWAITGTTKAVTFHTGSQVAKNKQDCANFHAEDKERAMMFGKKHVGQINGKQLRLMDGVVTQIAQYNGTVTIAGATTSMAQFRVFLQAIFSKNVRGQPNERIAYSGNGALAVLNEAARKDVTYQMFEPQEAFGIKFTRFVTPFGEIKVMTHPLMTESPNWTRDLHVLHPGGIKKRTLRPTFSENYDSDGNRILGQDSDEGYISTEFTLALMAGQTMGSLLQLTAPLASA